LEGQSPAARPLNQSIDQLPATQRHYAWGPSHEVRSARFFTGHAWGPKSTVMGEFAVLG
jgi:hypothetical protein